MRWRCSMGATYAYSFSWRGHRAVMYGASASETMGVPGGSRHFSEASMASGSAKEMREGMTGVKRAAEWDPPQRCGKNARQATAGGELVVSSGSAANPSKYCLAVFIHAPPEACHAFDFSSFTGALQSEVFIGGRGSDDGLEGDVFVPGVARSVVISKQLIAKEISRCLQLKVHDFGTVDEPEGGYRGWIETDIPCDVGGPNVKQRFIGDYGFGRYEAMESASDDLVKYMYKQSGVIIKVINYDEVKKLEWKLSAEKSWSKFFCDKLDQRVKEQKAMCFGYENLVADAKRMCQKFKGVLAIETTGEEDLLLGMDGVKVIYNGPRHPQSEMEWLAFDLVSLVNKSSDLEGIVHQMGKMGQGSSRPRMYRRA